MSRRRTERLALLLKLQRMKEDQAARALALRREQGDAARRSLRQLAEYREEYGRSGHSTPGQATSPWALTNGERFGRALATASEQQQRVVEQADQLEASARQHWGAVHVRRRLLEQLEERHRKALQSLEDRRLQNELDDRRRPGENS